MQWNVRIPLRDGIHLSAMLYLPKDHAAPSPVIVTMTPYTAQLYHEGALHYASHGYPFLAVDVRGRGNSEGVFKPNINEAKDGYDLIEWAARQPYCNGKVVMRGASYGGYCQWATAKEFPPHLATIVPTASPCFAVDFPIRKNIAPTYLMQWLTLVWGRTLQDKLFWGQERFWNEGFRQWFESGRPFKELDTQLGNPSAIFQEWLEHPHQDEYWDQYNPTAEQYAKIDIPVLTITGSYDGDQPGALEHYRQHLKHNPKAQHCLVIGPWDHAGCGKPQAEFGGIKCGPESLLDVQQLHRQWYAWTAEGGPKPEFLKNKVACYVMGAEKWRYADSLEAITARSEPLYLHSDENPLDVFQSGTLSAEQPAGSKPDQYVYDPRDVSLAEVESEPVLHGVIDQRMVHAAYGKALVYHSAPFEEDTEVSGFFKLSLWLAIDQPDTDFRATVYEVALDGSVIRLTADWLRARYRESLREEKLIETTEPLRYDFDRFMFISRQIKKGHRLRLIIGPINSIHSQKNYNSGGVVSEESMKDARTVTVRLFHDEKHPSVLYVPLGQIKTASGRHCAILNP